MSTAGLGAEPPRDLRGRDLKAWQAQQAHDAAAAALARMQTAQRVLRGRFAEPPADPGAAAELAGLDDAADAQAVRHREATERNPVAGDGGELLRAAVALRQVAFDCARLADRLEAFADRHPAAP